MTKEIESIRNTETGRSMVEMLGVLAIIGVLSIGGIASYRYAMDKMNTNEILDGISKRALVLSQQISSGAQNLSLTEFENTIRGNMGVTLTRYANGFDLNVTNVPKATCNTLLRNPLPSAVDTYANDQADDCLLDTNTVVFSFMNDLEEDPEEGCDPCTAACDETCHGQTTYGTPYTCTGGVCRCDDDHSSGYPVCQCLAKGTLITLANGQTKPIEDITYEDNLLVWDFDKGMFASAKPLWIKKRQTADRYNKITFNDGRVLKTISQHRIFNKELGKFTYPMTDETPEGTTTFTDKGQDLTVVSREVVVDKVDYYNIITNYHMNCFANGILTSCRFSNLYPIRDMKYVPDNRVSVPYEGHFDALPYKWYTGLRLSEQPEQINRGNDDTHANSIVEHIQNVYIALAV